MSYSGSKKPTFFKRISLILLLGCFAFLPMSCSFNRPKFNIIFSANLGGNQDLYSVSGSYFQSIERLTFTPDERESGLYINKDSKKLLYSISNKLASATILDLESKKITEIDNAIFATTMGWTPDGKEAILLSKSDELFTATLEGKLARVLSIPHIFEYSTLDSLNFSPDGKLIVYSENHFYERPPSSINSTFIYDVEKEQVIQLDNPSAICSFPSWSPTEWKIIVYCDLDLTDSQPDRHIYLFEIPKNDPGHFVKAADISLCKDGFSSLSWSPTGERFIARCRTHGTWKWILFDNDGNYAGVILPPVGTKEKPIYAVQMAWSPDGQKIVYTAGLDDNSMQIYIVDVDGSNNRLLIKETSNYSWLRTYPLIP